MQGGIDWTQVQISERDRRAIVEEVNKKNGYQFISLLGKSNSQIFKVKKSKKQFAAKLIKIEREDEDKPEQDKLQESKFKQGIGEIEMMMKAKEKGFNNAVKIQNHYEVAVTPKRKYLIIIMQILQKILANELKKIMSIGDGFSKKVCFKLAQAVYLMHKTANIIHRDIKPENIAIETDYKDQVQVKLLDFGISKMCQNNRQTRTLVGRGTLDYIAPQLRADLHDDEQSQQLKYDYTVDYWALGIVMIEVSFGNKISKLKIDLKTKNIQNIAKMIKDEELRQLILLLISIKPESRRKADQIMQKLIQSKGVKVDKLSQKLLDQIEYKKRLLQKRRAQKKEAIESEPRLLVKPTLFYKEVEKIKCKQVVETKQMMVQVIQEVKRIVPINIYITQIVTLKKLVQKIIQIDEDKGQPIIVQYIVQVPEIVEIFQEQQFSYYVLEETAVPFEVEEIKIFEKKTKIELPNFIVDDQKAEKTKYPVWLTKQSDEVVTLQKVEMVQCVLVKERLVSHETSLVQTKLVQLTEQIPVFVSKKSGERVGMGKGVVMRKKQVLKRIEKQTKKRIPKLIETKIEKFVELINVKYVVLELVETSTVDIYISKADEVKIK